MSAGLTTSVVAGLAVGIALIVLFSVLTKPAFTVSDDEIRTKVRNLPEVQAYYERYTPLEQIRRDGTTTLVTYELTRVLYYPDNSICGQVGPFCDDDEYRTLLLTVKVDSFGKIRMVVECDGLVSILVSDDILEIIKTTNCLENQGLVYAS